MNMNMNKRLSRVDLLSFSPVAFRLLDLYSGGNQRRDKQMQNLFHWFGYQFFRHFENLRKFEKKSWEFSESARACSQTT